jgi:hypothetical protein
MASRGQVLRAPLHPVAAHHGSPAPGRHCQAQHFRDSGASGGEAEDARWMGEKWGKRWVPSSKLT